MLVPLRPLTISLLVCLIAPSLAWNPFAKDGLFTKITEALPGGGFITAPIHAAAGNPTNALQAAVAGFYTLGSLVVDGPAGALVAGIDVARGKLDIKPEEVAGAILTKTGSGGVSRIFDESNLNGARKQEAVRAVTSGDSSRVGQIVLEAVEEKIRDSTKKLSAEAGGRKSLKSAHGTYLRANEPEWKADLASAPARDWENWYIEDWKGKVVLKGRGAPNKPGQFLRARPDGSIDLTGAHPKSVPEALWKPFKNEDGSWSFLSVHGTWLSANTNGAVYTVVRCDAWEHFWLERW